MSAEMDAMHDDPARFWENRYKQSTARTRGEPGAAFRRFAEGLVPGRALELGCGKGDEAVWLALQGWSVVAVEIAAAALDHVAANAARAGVVDRLSLERHDLTRTFPAGRFDLVTASFLAASPREPVFRRAADAVAPGGHLLIIDHGSRAPWSWAAADHRFLTAEETLASIGLDDTDWHRQHVGSLERRATGPNGETADVLDAVIFVQRL